MTSWTSKMWIRANGLPWCATSPTKHKQRHHSMQSPTAHLFPATVILVCLAGSIIPQCHGFFFPKSFFRKSNENQVTLPSSQQHPRVLAGGSQQNAYGGDHLQGSGTDVQPATRIVNRPPFQPPRNNDQAQQASGPVPGSGFHVPRELCLACERFPWMPVAGERPTVGAASSTVSQSQQPRQPYGQNTTPTKTIIINALGEAQGPVPVPPPLPSRRPFAIQFDGTQSGNKVNHQEAPKQAAPPSAPAHPLQQQGYGQPQQNFAGNQQQPLQQDNTPQSQPKPERPVTFQIFQAPNQQQSQPTVLHQAPIGLQPPPIPQAYGPPTVLVPANTHSAQVEANFNVQSNQQGHLPPPPHAVGSIIASQQNNAHLPQFQKIEPAELVYQEHFTSSPPAPQNIKVPIIPNQKPYQAQKPVQGNIASNNGEFLTLQGYGRPPSESFRQGLGPGGMFLHMRPPPTIQGSPPPRPALDMKPPHPMIHYGKPIRIPNNIGPQRPSGQVLYPPPQAFLQMAPPPPLPQSQTINGAYGVPTTNSLESSGRPQDERRPAPSGQVFNFQHPIQQTQTNRPPMPASSHLQSVQPVPIPIPTNVHTSSSQQEVGTDGININRPNKLESTFTQEAGWEIIPSIQTDLTHLFSREKGKPSPQGGNELPVPVPIPVPQSHPPKSPFFIVAGAGQQQQQQQEQIKVQDVTYHEESRNPVPSVSSPLNNINTVGKQQQQNNDQQQNALNSNSLAANEDQQTGDQEQQQRPQIPALPQQFIRGRPFILGVPTGQARPVIFRPHPQQPQPFQQLHPSIMTALNHAQQTSLLTHQYFRQPVNVAQPIRENTIYVSPAANAQQIQHLQQNQQNNAPLAESSSNSVQETKTHEANNLDEQQQQQEHQQQQQNYGIDPRIPTSSSSSEQTNPNCQGTQHLQQPYLIPITTHQKEQQLQQQQQQHQQNQETEHVVDQSIFSPSVSAPSKDDQSQLFTTTGEENNGNEDHISSSPDSLAPMPTYTTSLASVPPTVATIGVSDTPGFRGSINVQDNGNKGSYLIYYRRPVSNKSPVYWVQPSRTVSQGVVRLNPQIAPVAPSLPSTVVAWSRPRVVVANQFRTPQQPEEQGRYEDPTTSDEARSQASYERESEEQEQSMQVSSGQHSDDNENIPYGQKLGVTRDNTKGQAPYDIISVGGSDDEAQSLEETSGSSDRSQGIEFAEPAEKEPFGDSEFAPTGQDAASTGIGNVNTPTFSGPSSEFPEQGNLENENSLQSVQQETKDSHQDENEDADDERDDFGFRPQTVFRKPISTTVIHSPGASSFQSLKLPNFKPHRVIVHDFTTHSANAAATGPSASASEPQESIETSKGQTFATETTSSAWTASQRLKSPKLVENSDDEEESSESINRPQGFNIQEVIASGPVSTADCLTTAHSGHLLTSLSSTSPRTTDSLSTSATSAKGRDIFLPLGSRFPAGRPSIFSTIRRPFSPPISVPPTTTSSTTTSSPSTTSVSSFTSESTPESYSKRERYLGQSPSGFAASIAVPVYRRPIHINHAARDPLDREGISAGSGVGSGSSNINSDSVTYIKPQANIILTTEDIYKPSEERVVDNVSNNDSIKVVESSTSVSTSLVNSETIDSQDEIMSTEKSSSFSVSVVDEKSSTSGFTSNRDERGFTASFGNNDISQQVGTKHGKMNVVQVTSVPVISDAEPITTTVSTLASASADGLTSTTAVPLPASTSTKIVKTVRVRQRMRSGSLNGPLRTRFHGSGRVRVVHRPANQEYIRHFPEFATQEGDKLAKEEEQEVKNALIELKKSPDSVKTH